MTKIVSNKYDYDLINDSLFFYKEGEKYKSSLDFEGIILDFSEDDNLMNIEILDASKKFHVSKSELHNLQLFNATIEVNKENIKVAMKLEVHKRNQLLKKFSEALIPNIFNLPNSKQGIAVTC